MREVAPGGLEIRLASDPEADAVDVWRFGDDPECERFTAMIPVRIGIEQVGVIDLRAVFAPT